MNEAAATTDLATKTPANLRAIAMRMGKPFRTPRTAAERREIIAWIESHAAERQAEDAGSAKLDLSASSTTAELEPTLYAPGYGVLSTNAAINLLLEGHSVSVGYVDPATDMVVREAGPSIELFPTHARYPAAGVVAFEISLSSGRLSSPRDGDRFASLLAQARLLQVEAARALVAANRKATKS